MVLTNIICIYGGGGEESINDFLKSVGNWSLAPYVQINITISEHDLDQYNYDCYFGEHFLINRRTLKKYCFDYILIKSIRQEEIRDKLNFWGIQNKKLCSFYMSDLLHIGCVQYHALICDSFQNLVFDFEKTCHIDSLVIGTSYHKLGIDASSFLKYKMFNFSLASQDIFFHYEIVKFLFDNFPDKMQEINTVIIGLCHYSLEYDFSKSAIKQWIVRYYPYLSSAHNMMPEKQWKILGRKLLSEVHSHETEYNWFITSHTDDNSFSELDAKHSAEIDCHKNYPLTVAENKALLSEFINYLKAHNIKPIGLVMPVSKSYRQYIDNKMLKNFRDYVATLDFVCLDYFDADMPDDYFADPSHLCKNGAQIFTTKLETDLLKLL